MSQVVEQIAELTGFRDRDVLDVSLVSALRDLLGPDEVAIYRCVGEGANRRWMTRARLARGDAVARTDALWARARYRSAGETIPLIDGDPAAPLVAEDGWEIGRVLLR